MLRLRRIAVPLVAVLTVGVLASACQLNFLWQSTTYPGGPGWPFGLGDNGQANVTLDGNYIDVTIDGDWTQTLMNVETGCINKQQEDLAYNSCMLDAVGKFLPGGFFGGVINYALQDPNCVIPGSDDPNECVYGRSLYSATLEYVFGLGASGCVGFRVNLITQRIEQNSWYAETYAPLQGGSNVPGQAWCYAT